MTDLSPRFARLVEDGVGCAVSFNLILDTNVLLDAVAGRHALRVGGAARIQDNALRVVDYAFEHCAVCFTQKTQHELQGTFLGFVGESRLPDVDRQQEFDRIMERASFVEQGPLATVCGDRKDDKMIRAALGANALYLVTFDRGLLGLHHVGGTRVLRPEDFIREVMGEDMPRHRPRSIFLAAGRCTPSRHAGRGAGSVVCAWQVCRSSCPV